MRNEIRGDDPRAIWQSQKTEPYVMTLEEIRQKARALRARTRKKLLGTLTGPLAAAFFYAFSLKEFPALRETLQPLFVGAIAWSLVGLYLLNRRMWSTVAYEDAGLSTGLESCRGEIERQRQILRRVLLWSFGPVLLAIGTFILALATVGRSGAGPRLLPDALPFLALVIVWVVGYFVIRYREQRNLRRELDELDEIESENSR